MEPYFGSFWQGSYWLEVDGIETALPLVVEI
jgi:hypothetical protein